VAQVELSKNVFFSKGHVKSDHHPYPGGFCKNCCEICAVNHNRISSKLLLLPKLPEDIGNASVIKDTLQIHKLKRKTNQREEYSIKFFKTAADGEPFYTQWCKVGGLICGHQYS